MLPKRLYTCVISAQRMVILPLLPLFLLLLPLPSSSNPRGSQKVSPSFLASPHLSQDHHFIRVVVMADESMLEHYGNMERLVQYVLTLMRGVNELYRKGHLGKKLIISLGKVFLSKNIHRIMKEVGNPREKLKSLCKWQKHRTSVPGHHLSLFLTRRNLCNFELLKTNQTDCHTLGLAKTRSFCNEEESCVLNQDIGFNTIHTIAHEIAHTFGVSHDEKAENNGSYYIMYPNIKTDVPSRLSDFIWSQQSRSQFQKFLMARSGSKCLTSANQYEEDLMAFPDHPSIPPGISWTGDEQCRFAFADVIDSRQEAVRRCKLDSGSCSELWCLVRGSCMRVPVLSLEGTICGHHRWCMRGSCQVMSQMDESEGQWEEWSSWSSCSRNCRAGLSYSRRRCIPSKSGQFCKEGYEDTRHKLCNLDSKEDCPSPDPRYECIKAIWPRRLTVKSSSRNQCLIYCDFKRMDSPTEEEEEVRQILTVEEGTFCSDSEEKVCIDGDCVPMDCDGRINSNVVKDKCGVCGGNGTTCATLREEKLIQNVETRLIFITEFSEKAFHIRINMSLPHAYHDKERVYLAASAEHNGFTNILHMYNDIRSTGVYFLRDEYSGKKIQISYSDADQQFIHSSLNISSGFKHKVIRLYILNPSQTFIHQVKLSWSYNFPLKNQSPGTIRNAALSSRIQLRCNHMECGTWWTGKWQECDPRTKQETRSLFCLKSDRRPQPQDFCDQNIKPDVYRDCDPQILSNSFPVEEQWEWAPGTWSSCSETCGYGLRKRDYICLRPENLCDPSRRPPSDTKECFSRRCQFSWWFGSWGRCENGYQRRRVYCFDEVEDTEVDPNKCLEAKKPKDYQDCSLL